MWFFKNDGPIDEAMERQLMRRLVSEAQDRFGKALRRVLLLPPDLTRFHSGAGRLANILYHILGPECRVDVIPTLGQHQPHTEAENHWMFGDIPESCIQVHDWRRSCVTLGEIDAEFVRYVTNGKANWPIPVELNRAPLEGDYDLIINIGQVVPHEVLGFANHNKNYFIGLGGKSMICASHMLAAAYGIEDNLGQIVTPLRACYHLAERRYLGGIPDVYVLIVKNQAADGHPATLGLFVGEDTDTYLQAARQARHACLHLFEHPLKRIVCVMDPREFRSTWVANKAIYRTRKAVADGGELLVIAPGVERFGEQPEVDRLIRKYGYKGTAHTLSALQTDPELRDFGHAAAHLIHGSSEGRFTITYATGKLTRSEVEGVGFNYMDLQTALDTYCPDAGPPEDGFRSAGGAPYYLIHSPSLGLWTARNAFRESLTTNLSFAERMCERDPLEPMWRRLANWDRDDLAQMQP